MVSLYPEFDGRKLIPTKRGAKEMEEIGMDMWDAADVLKEGYDCSRSRRGPAKVERCLPIGRKVIRVVVVEGVFDPKGNPEEVYYIIHASEESSRKDRMMGDGSKKSKEKGPHCFRCGSLMRPKTLRLGDIEVRAWRCSKDKEEIIHPEDAQKALLLNKLKKQGVKVRIGILNEAPYLRFPKEFRDIVKKGDEVLVRVVSGKVIELVISDQ
jgi:hypothetical protein